MRLRTNWITCPSLLLPLCATRFAMGVFLYEMGTIFTISHGLAPRVLSLMACLQRGAALPQISRLSPRFFTPVLERTLQLLQCLQAWVYDRILEKIRSSSCKRSSSAINSLRLFSAGVIFVNGVAPPFTKITQRTTLCTSLARPSV